MIKVLAVGASLVAVGVVLAIVALGKVRCVQLKELN